MYAMWERMSKIISKLSSVFQKQYELSLSPIVGLPQRLPRWSFCDAKGMPRINSNYE